MNSGNTSIYTVFADLLTFCIAASAMFVVKVGGDLPVSTILLAVTIAFLLIAKGNRLMRPLFGKLFILWALWLFGQVLTDFYRHTEMHDWIRGDARILSVGLDLLGVAILVGRSSRRQVIFIAGYAIGSILQVKLQPNEYTDHWKFGYASGVTLVVLLLSCLFYSRGHHAVVVSLLFGISAIHAAMNFRSPILLLLITTALVTPIVPGRIGRMKVLPASGRMRVLVLAGLAIVAGKAASSTIVFLSTNGYLGEQARLKTTTQVESKGGLLLGGRPEILISSRAVMDSPILGHGSWAKDRKYVAMYQNLLVEYGLKEQEAEDPGYGDLIPSHSHIMGAWVEAGILGPGFWIFSLLLAVRAIVRLSLDRPALAPLYCYGLLGFIWADLFSPAGSTALLPNCFWIAVACDLIESAPLRKYQDRPMSVGRRSLIQPQAVARIPEFPARG